MQDKEFESFRAFRLSTGGLLYRLFKLMHIQKSDSYSVYRRIIIIVSLIWLPLLVLTIIEGNFYNTNLDLPFSYDLQPYVKYLIVLPLLMASGAIIDPLIRYVIESIGTSGILGESNKGRYYEAVKQLARRKNSNFADLVIIIISYSVAITGVINLEMFDVSSQFRNWTVFHSESGTHLTLAGWWFIMVSAPVLQIIFYRWFWRFYLWGKFLFQVSRIKLNLQPTHPDLAGGLGILKNSENAFIIIFFSLGAMLSVSLSADILYTGQKLEQVIPIIIAYIIISVSVLTIPLFFFSHQLAATKRWGSVLYGDLGYRLSRAFHEKWGNIEDETNGDELLKTADSSTVCDYAEIYNAARGMRFIPISLRGLLLQACALTIPFLPLVFTEHSPIEILKTILQSLI